MEEKKNYKEAYEKEHYKSTYLASRVAELEDQVDDLQFKLDRIKNNPIWKASAPFPKMYAFCDPPGRPAEKLRQHAGVFAKMKYKANERKAMRHYGTESFPNEQERKAQEEAVFDRMVKISILTPLYNTPEDFLREMIDSVRNQTYGNWELCLADGSVTMSMPMWARSARKYAEKDSAYRLSEAGARTRASRAIRTNA